MRHTQIASDHERTHVLVFDTGEEAIAGLLQFARERRLASAHLSAIGAFSEVTLGFFDWSRKDYRRIRVDEQVEVLSLAGNLARDADDEVKLHAHVVVGKSDGTAHGGHLLDARVRPTLEVVVTEAPAPLRRRVRPDLGLALLEP
ncbi:MAG: PPC domain-containing DNA-binding protein [Vicinamibacterales bacterium]